MSVLLQTAQNRKDLTVPNSFMPKPGKDTIKKKKKAVSMMNMDVIVINNITNTSHQIPQHINKAIVDG